jgi:hypothetical protein
MLLDDFEMPVEREYGAVVFLGNDCNVAVCEIRRISLSPERIRKLSRFEPTFVCLIDDRERPEKPLDYGYFPIGFGTLDQFSQYDPGHAHVTRGKAIIDLFGDPGVPVSEELYPGRCIDQHSFSAHNA